MGMGRFLVGPLGNMDLPSYRWWNSKRKEYNLKFISCLLAAQILFFIAYLTLDISDSESILSRIYRALLVDILIIFIINLLYFLWPTLESLFFKKINKLYRRYCFAVLNLSNIFFVVCALVFVIYITGLASSLYIALFDQERITYKITAKDTLKSVDYTESFDIYINRVSELKTVGFSSIESSIDQGHATISFIGLSPNIELLAYYANNKGYLEAKIIGEYGIIIDSSDIQNSSPGFIGNNPVIDVLISETAGVKMHKITSSNLGGRIEMKLDGVTILRGAINEPLGRSFRLGGKSVSDTTKQAVLLKYGALENELIITRVY